jgi:hypothetical protein
MFKLSAYKYSYNQILSICKLSMYEHVEPATVCWPTQTVFIFGGLRTDIESFSVAENSPSDRLVFWLLAEVGERFL